MDSALATSILHTEDESSIIEWYAYHNLLTLHNSMGCEDLICPSIASKSTVLQPVVCEPIVSQGMMFFSQELWYNLKESLTARMR